MEEDKERVLGLREKWEMGNGGGNGGDGGIEKGSFKEWIWRCEM